MIVVVMEVIMLANWCYYCGHDCCGDESDSSRLIGVTVVVMKLL